MEANFTPEYFLDEIRDGFYVPSILKRVWAEHISIICEIDKVCKKYNIRWYAAWGTLLGAVRHGGFIPWDDDIDIFMFRDDYYRFRDEAVNDLPDSFFAKTIWNDLKCYSDILRVNNTHGEDITGEYLNNHNGCFYGCGVDILPLDIVRGNLDATKELREILRELCLLKAAALDDVKYLKKEQLLKIENYGIKLDEAYPLPNACVRTMIKLLENEASKVTNDGCAVPANCWCYDEKTYDLNWFDDVIFTGFENIDIPVPVCWNEVLRTHFGDYSQKIRGGSDHSFPYFKDSQEKLWIEAPELKYTPTKDEFRNKKYYSLHDRDGYLNGIEKGIVVFMPVSISDWHYMSSVYDSFTKQGHKCLVMPIPYMLRKNDRGFLDLCWEGNEFVSNGINITRYDQFDFGNPRASAIVISDVYDSYNGGYSVHPFFYSTNIRKFTDMLIYVQCFDVDLSSLDGTVCWTTEYFVKQPGIACADRLILRDEISMDAYEKIISSWKL